MASNNMAPAPLFKTPEEVAAQSSMNNNDSAAQHVTHLPPAIDPSTSSVTATKPATVPPPASSTTFSHTDTSILQGPGSVVHPPAASVPPALRTPSAVSQESSDQWAAHALDAIAPNEQGQFASQVQQPSSSVASTPGLDIPGSYPRSAADSNAPDVDLQYVKQTAANVASTVVETARNVAAAAVPVMQSAAQTAVPAVQNAAGYVKQNAPAAAATTRDTAGNAAGVVSDTTSNVASTVGSTASNAAGTVGNSASNAAGAVGSTASNVGGTVSNSASNAAGTVSNTASRAAETVGNTVAPVTSSVSSTAGSVGSTVREYAASAGDALKPYIPAAVAGVLPSHATAATGVDSLTGDGIARLPEETRTAGFPSHDDEGITPLGKTGGAGPLPGTAQETGVAVLPDERNTKDETAEVHSTRVAPFHKEVAPKDDASHIPNFSIQPILGKGSAAPSGLPTRDTPEVSTHAPVTSIDKPTDNKATYSAPIGPDATKANIGTPTHIPEGKMHDKTYIAPIGPQPTGASANASIKTLPGSKKTSKDDLKASSGIAGIGAHDPLNHHPRTHMGATLAEMNTERSELGQPPADNRTPAVPPKDRIDSDRATTGHSAPISTTTNTLSHAQPPTGTGANTNHSTSDQAGRIPAGERTKDTTAGVTSGAGAATTAPGFGVGHTAGVHAETHPTYGQHDGAKASAAGDNNTSSSHYTTTSSTLSSSDSADSKGEKKHGFMSKLKGEVKVISGKLGHNEAKVEEGRKMMGKN